MPFDAGPLRRNELVWRNLMESLGLVGVKCRRATDNDRASRATGSLV
jgi:hypothetical protein